MTQHAKQMKQMSTTINQIVDLGVADVVVAEVRGRLNGLTAETPARYEVVRAGIAEVRKLRVGVEQSRKLLKASSLAFGRNVDAEAKRVTAMLVEIESPLKAAKEDIDEGKRRIARAAIEAAEKEAEAKRKAEQEELDRIEAARQAAIEAEQAEARRRLVEEQVKLAAEQKILDEERRVLREKQEAERLEIKRERDALQADRDEIEAMKEATRQAVRDKERAEQLDAQKVELKKKAEAKAAEAKREADARRPDGEKLLAFVDALVDFEVSVPATSTKWGQALAERCSVSILRIADELQREATQ